MTGADQVASERLDIGIVHRFPDDRGPDPATGYVIVQVDGEIDEYTADLLRQRTIAAALAVAPAATPRVVLDLDRVGFCDSAGLGALVAIWKAVRAQDGELAVARAPEVCRRIMERTGLTRYITTTPTLEAAIAHITR